MLWEWELSMGSRKRDPKGWFEWWIYSYICFVSTLINSYKKEPLGQPVKRYALETQWNSHQRGIVWMWESFSNASASGDIRWLTLERSHLSIFCVGKVCGKNLTLETTTEWTLERSLMSVMTMGMPSVNMLISKDTRELTLENSICKLVVGEIFQSFVSHYKTWVKQYRRGNHESLQ